ncbi:uncharacterized protein [Elaeis guineensis]|uniref:uncharacterized protein n=1 Tax=Elaeis guineensis var. tenera TaxID=51953 RepID=UPI003C6D40DE
MDKDQNKIPTNSLLWDCGSSLYDSFELKSFKRQLDSAIASRCLSMPHLSDPPPLPPPPVRSTKKHSKFSKSLHKLLRSVFQLRPLFRVRLQTAQHNEDGYHGVYSRSESYVSIAEGSPRGISGRQSSTRW